MASILVVADEDSIAPNDILVQRAWDHDQKTIEALTDLWDAIPGPDDECSPGLSLVRSAIRRNDCAYARRVLDRMELKSADALNLNGIVHELAGEFIQAFSAYRKALEFRPDHVAAQMNVRRCFEMNAFGESSVPIFL
jgi:hypothetical protein